MNLQFLNMQKKAADLGNPSAMNLVAVCYEKGFGTEKDDSKAVEVGHIEALIGIAMCYHNGIGVEKMKKNMMNT